MELGSLLPLMKWHKTETILLVCRAANSPLTTEYLTHQGQLFSHRKRLLFSFAYDQKGATNYDKAKRENP